MTMHVTHHLGAALPQGRAAHPARQAAIGRREAPFIHRGIGGHQPGDTRVGCGFQHPVQFFPGQVRGYFYKHGRRGKSRAFGRLPNRPQQPGQGFPPLQGPQLGGVGRTHVHHQIIGQGREDAGQRGVIFFRPLVGRGLVSAQVHPQHQAGRALPPQTSGHESRAPAGETHPVDQGPGLGHPHDTGAGIARLGAQGDRTHLDESEAQRGQAPPGQAVLVVARGQAHGVAKAQSGHLYGLLRQGQPAAQGGPRRRQRAGQPQQPHRQVVGRFRVQTVQPANPGTPGHGQNPRPRRQTPPSRGLGRRKNALRPASAFHGTMNSS